MKVLVLNRVATRIAAVLLVLTGLFKLIDAANPNRYFESRDAVLTFVTHRQMLWLAGGLEIALAIYIYFIPNVRTCGLALLWFCGLIVTYKCGLWLTYFTEPCSCLGILGHMFKITNRQTEFITWALLAAFTAIGIMACNSNERTLEKKGGALPQ